MSSERLPFVMGVETRHKTTKAAIASVRDGIVSMRNRAGQGIYARVVHSRFYGVTSALHVYHDPSLGERQRRDLFRTVASQEEALAQSDEITEREAKRYSAYFVIERAKDGTFTFERNYDKIDAIAQNNGFFCLLTTTGMTSSEVLSIYRRRDMIEKNFDDLKNHMDMKRLHTHTKETTDGKLFLAFISLIAVSEMGVKLAEMMKERSWSKGSVITELEKIRVVIAAGGKRLMNPVTKTQRLIFEALGLGVNDLNSYITNTETNTRMCSKLPEI
jgi:transposase